MKRLLSIILSISCLFLISCQKEDIAVPTTVFIEKEKTPVSYAVTTSVFPAVHDGKVIEQCYLENGSVLQEEICTDTHSATQYWCNFLDSNGTCVFSVTPAVDMGYDVTQDNITSGEVFHLVDALYVEQDKENLFLLLTPEGICAYSEEGTLKYSNRALICDDIFIYEDSVFLLTGNADQQKILKIDSSDGEILEKYTFDEAYIAFEALGDTDMIFVSDDAQLYATNASGLYQLNLSEKNHSISLQQITDWSASHILPETIRSIRVIDAQTIELIQSDLASDAIYTIQYTRATQDELSEANDVILAVFTTRNDYALSVFYFNQNAQNAKIEIRDYSVYEQEQQNLRFHTDIAAGDPPDMVILWQSDTLDSTISTNERAGIFTDLTTLFQENQIMHSDDLLAYVTEPYKYNGKQYIFPLNPSVSCYFGNTAYFDGSVTIDEYLDICEENDLGCLNAKPLFSAAVDDHYNETTADCTFHNGTLAKQMTRATTLQQNTNAQPLQKITLSYTSLFQYTEAMVSLGEEWIPVGHPNAKKELCMDNSLAEYYAILASSTHKDVAVDFLHTLMQDNTPSIKADTDDALLSLCYGYTFYKSDIYEQLSYFEGKTIVIDSMLYSVYDDDDPTLSEAKGFHLQLTKADADSMVSFLDSITRRVNNASPVQKIFWEEYWAMDDRPIETMLDFVQSKVSIYLSEQLD